MPSSSGCFCKPCNLEFASDVFDSCPVCHSPPVEGARRPWARTEFLIRNFGDTSDPIVRLHADQTNVNKNMAVMAAAWVGIAIVLICFRVFQGVDFHVPFVSAGTLLAVLAVVFGIALLYMKNFRPIEVLRDGSLRIPRAATAPRSMTGVLINAAIKASHDASERSYYKLPTAQWLPYVERMGNGEALSLVNELVQPGMRPFFTKVDSQIVEVRNTLNALATESL